MTDHELNHNCKNNQVGEYGLAQLQRHLKFQPFIPLIPLYTARLGVKSKILKGTYKESVLLLTSFAAGLEHCIVGHDVRDHFSTTFPHLLQQPDGFLPLRWLGMAVCSEERVATHPAGSVHLP